MIRMKTDFQTMVTCNEIKCKEVQGAVADVTLAGALVTFSPASSARDGGAGAFSGDERLLVISGIFVGTTLAFAAVILAGAVPLGAVAAVILGPDLVFSPASSARDGGAGAFIGDEALLDVTLVGAAVTLDGALADVTLVGAAVTLDGALADVTLVGAAVTLDGALADVTLVGAAVTIDGALADVTLVGAAVTLDGA